MPIGLVPPSGLRSPTRKQSPRSERVSLGFLLAQLHYERPRLGALNLESRLCWRGGGRRRGDDDCCGSKKGGRRDGRICCAGGCYRG